MSLASIPAARRGGMFSVVKQVVRMLARTPEVKKVVVLCFDRREVADGIRRTISDSVTVPTVLTKTAASTAAAASSVDRAKSVPVIVQKVFHLGIVGRHSTRTFVQQTFVEPSCHKVRALLLGLRCRRDDAGRERKHRIDAAASRIGLKLYEVPSWWGSDTRVPSYELPDALQIDGAPWRTEGKTAEEIMEIILQHVDFPSSAWGTKANGQSCSCGRACSPGAGCKKGQKCRCHGCSELVQVGYNECHPGAGCKKGQKCCCHGCSELVQVGLNECPPGAGCKKGQKCRCHGCSELVQVGLNECPLGAGCKKGQMSTKQLKGRAKKARKIEQLRAAGMLCPYCHERKMGKGRRACQACCKSRKKPEF